MSDIDAIFHEITDIDQKLAELPDDAYDERARLQERHEELRRQAAELAAASDADRPTGDIEAELASLRQQLDAIEGERIDMVQQSGGGDASGPGAEGLGGVSLNQQIESAQGADQIKARIAQLKKQLSERGVDPGDNL
jgi:DNA repair exonuclease SbcCD ATPase subunit